MKDYELVEYKGNKYYVCRYVKKNGISKLFIVDEDDMDKVLEQEHSWLLINGHIGYSEMINRFTYQHYLHNIIMDKPPNEAKGQKYIINFIDKNVHDIRKDNLLLATQNSNYANRKSRKRKCELPEDCGIKMKDIPRCVFYCKPQSGHGELFVIEFKKDGEKHVWKSSSAKNVSLKDKLIEIKEKLLDISVAYPELLNDKCIQNHTHEQIRLTKQFNSIIKLSGYECIKSNLMKIPKQTTVKSNKDGRETKKRSSGSKTGKQVNSKEIIEV